MRIDKFLWFTRLAKTRSVAQAIVEDGRLRIDGRSVHRSHGPIHIGEVLTFVHQDHIRIIRVERLPARRGSPNEAAACITDLSPVDAGLRPT